MANRSVRDQTQIDKDFYHQVMKYRNYRDASEALGVSHDSVKHRMADIKRRGYVPEAHWNHLQPQPVRGVSTAYDADGNIIMQWVKTEAQKKVERDVVQELRETLSDIKPVKPVKRKIKAAGHDDVLAVFPMGDPHIGMYAWAEECGEDFNSDIARRDLHQATMHLVECAPLSKKALIVNLGDFFHADNFNNMTARSGNVLDVDTRWSRVLRTGFLAMVDCINAALKKFQEVEVINNAGNHDDHSSRALTVALQAMFHKEPRVKIQDPYGWFNYYHFGKVLIGTTHGDKVKMADLAEIMATDQPKLWGETEHRYWLTGHVHHKQLLELRGCIVESFRTLAAKDAWHHSYGYRAGRDMTSIIYHKNHGEISRNVCNISFVREQIGDKM